MASLLADLFSAGGYGASSTGTGKGGQGHGKAAAGGVVATVVKILRLVFIEVNATAMTNQPEIQVLRSKSMNTVPILYVFAQERDAGGVWRATQRLPDFTNPLTNFSSFQGASKYIQPHLDTHSAQYNAATLNGKGRKNFSFTHYYNSGGPNMVASLVVGMVRRLLVETFANLEGGPLVCYGLTSRGACGTIDDALQQHYQFALRAKMLKLMTHLGNGILANDEHRAIRPVKEPITNGLKIPGVGANAPTMDIRMEAPAYLLTELKVDAETRAVTAHIIDPHPDFKAMLEGGATKIKVGTEWAAPVAVPRPVPGEEGENAAANAAPPGGLGLDEGLGLL
eukprot:g17746.t1